MLLEWVFSWFGSSNQSKGLLIFSQHKRRLTGFKLSAFFLWRKNPFFTNLQAKGINIFLQETFSLSNSGKKTADIAYFQTKTIKKIIKLKLFKEDYTMKRRFLAIAIVLPVMGIWAPSALALDTLGPPAAAGLDQGQSSLGFDYAHSSMDLKLHNTKRSDNYGGSENLPSWKIKHFMTDVVTAKIGYSVTNDLECFVRLGALTTEDSKGTLSVGSVKYMGDMKDMGFDYGFGAKATFWKQDNLKVGGILQFGYAKPEGKVRIDRGETIGVVKCSSRVELREVQMAVGPTYKLSDDASIYGGPFLHYVNGNMRFEGNSSLYPEYNEKYSADISQQNCFGGFVGMQLDLDKYAPFILNVEWQHTATDDALGLNLTWKY